MPKGGDLHNHLSGAIYAETFIQWAAQGGLCVDIMQEMDPIALLQEMARRRVLVEICLTSNDAILGGRGRQHPLAMYLKYGVPTALATDDPGVALRDVARISEGD